MPNMALCQAAPLDPTRPRPATGPVSRRSGERGPVLRPKRRSPARARNAGVTNESGGGGRYLVVDGAAQAGEAADDGLGSETRETGVRKAGRVGAVGCDGARGYENEFEEA